MGDIPMDGISVADCGVAVASIFNSPEEFIGKAVGLSAEALTIQQYADVFSKILGKEVRDAKVSCQFSTGDCDHGRQPWFTWHILIGFIFIS